MRWPWRRKPIDLNEQLLREAEEARGEPYRHSQAWTASPNKIWASSISADRIIAAPMTMGPGDVVSVPKGTDLWGEAITGLIWTAEKPTNQYLKDHEGSTVAWVDADERCWIQTWGGKPMQFSGYQKGPGLR